VDAGKDDDIVYIDSDGYTVDIDMIEFWKNRKDSYIILSPH
jgi:hypothetical protein